MAHAEIAGAGDQGHRAVLLEADIGELGAGRRGGLEIGRDAEPAQPARGLAPPAASGEARGVGARHRPVHDRLEVARIVGQPDRGLERHLVGPDQVAPAQLDPVDAGLGRRLVDQQFEEIFRFRPPGAAIGAGRDGVGEHAFGAVGEQRGLVDADDVAADHHGHRPRPHRGQIGPHVAERVDLEREEIAVLVERERELDRHRPPLVVGEKALRAVGAPLDRAAQPARRVERADRLGIGRALHAEGAADIVADHPDPVRRHAEDRARQRRPVAGHPLAADMEGEFLRRRVVLRERRARLHRVDHHAGVVEADAGDVVRPGERRLDRRLVAHVEVEEDVPGTALPELGRVVGERPLDGRRGRERRDLEADGLRRVARLARGLGDHHGHRIADMAHPSDRERRARRHAGRRSVAVLHRHRAGDVADPVGFEVGPGIDREHAGGGAGGGDIEDRDLAVARRGAQEDRMGLAGRVDIVGVASAARKQARVLAARDRLADPEFERAVVGHRGGYSAAAPSLRRDDASIRATRSSVSWTSPKWR